MTDRDGATDRPTGTGDGGPVEEYLDRLFDLLGGSGGEGRRTLTEVESHLRDATDDGILEGLSREDAERRAVSRFGAARQVAGGIRAGAGAGDARSVLARAAGLLWLLGGIGMVAIGLSGPLVWAVGAVFGRDVVAPDTPGLRLPAARCAYLAEYYPHAASCHAASVAHHFDEEVRNRVAAGVLGLLALGAFWLLRRSRAGTGRLARLATLTRTPSTPLVAVVGAVAFGAGALILTGQGLDGVMIGRRAATGADLASAAVAALAFLAFLPPLVRQVHRPPRPDRTA